MTWRIFTFGSTISDHLNMSQLSHHPPKVYITCRDSGPSPPDGPRSFDQVLTCETISQAGQLATCKLGAAIGEASKIHWRKLAKAGKPTMQCNRLDTLQWLWNETNGSGSNPLGSAVANDSKTCSIHKCSHNLMHVHCCELPPRLLQSPLNGKYLCFLSRLKAPIRLLMRKHHLVKGTTVYACLQTTRLLQIQSMCTPGAGSFVSHL